MTTKELASELLPLAKALVSVLEKASGAHPGERFDSSRTDRRPVSDLTVDVLNLLREHPGMTTAQVAEHLHDPDSGMSIDLMKRRVAVNLSHQHKKRGTVIGRKVPGHKDLMWFINPSKTATPPREGGVTIHDGPVGAGS